jgi:abortive infection bacteriophage resistance protein
MVSFSKPPLTPSALIVKLKNQGMLFPDEKLALAYMQNVGAFRLKAYWYSLQDAGTKQFPINTDFTEIISKYEFDRLLRSATFLAIERLEIAIRSTISNQLAIRHGAHWYLKSHIFKPTADISYGSLIKKIEDEVQRSRGRTYIDAYNKKYDEPYIAHSWAITECVSFGFWSRAYKIIRDAADKKAISKKFNIEHPDVFSSWLHSLNYLRNLIAHHEKLMGITLAIAPMNYKAKSIKLGNKSFYDIATIINYMLVATKLPNSWKGDIQNLFSTNPMIRLADLGFPQNWDNEPSW